MPRGVLLRISDAMVLLAMAVLLGTAANLVRPQATRLPWVSDWDRHIETLAFRAGIPVTFLNGAQTRVGDPATAIIDARLPDEFAAGHLPRARSLPVADVEQRLVDYVSQLTPETPILVYCGGSECDDALELAKKLREFGFEDVTLYPGGIAEWVAYGGAIHTGGES
ncbi:MAG: rhodanese-like domain-containing protein [Kiritimatiellia bacterium]|jgi:rhodanese-related sulfurtransferase|nr:rhodanese-like domain-containing protein [Kiritimatiellia bacterium]